MSGEKTVTFARIALAVLLGVVVALIIIAIDHGPLPD